MAIEPLVQFSPFTKYFIYDYVHAYHPAIVVFQHFLKALGER